MGAIAGMLAQSGANIGQAIGSPVQRLGQNIGGMLSQRAEDRRTGDKEAEARALLEQYKDNPAQLRAIAQEYAIKQDPLAQVFASAAKAASETASKRVAAMDASRAAADSRSEAVGTRVDAMGTELERTRLEQNAIKKARATGDENIVSALRNSDADTLRSYLMQKPNAQAVNLSKGSVLVDPVTGRIIVSNVQEDKATQEVPTALHGKYTPSSIQDFATTNDYSKLVPITEPTKPGDLDATVQKELLRVGEQGTKAAVNLNVNRNLQASIAANPNRSTGLISELRTSVLNLAGKQDLEEADKIAFIRQRNAEIVTGLPPGVASDRDIELFSQGFPDASASTETILRYLQAEERILAARADQALLFDDFLAAQRDTGNKPSTIGFVRKQNAYGKSLSTLETRIASIKENAQQTGEDPSEAINKELNYFREVYNFVPTYYR